MPAPQKPQVKPKPKPKQKPKLKSVPVSHMVTMKFKAQFPMSALDKDEAVLKGGNELEQFLASCPIEGFSYTRGKGAANPV